MNYAEAERIALYKYGGMLHIPFFKGNIKRGKSCVCPDVVRVIDGHIETIEVKYIDFSHGYNHEGTFYKLKEQIRARKEHLPSDASQRVFILVANMKEWTKEEIKSYVADGLKDIYPNIPIDIEEVIARGGKSNANHTQG